MKGLKYQKTFSKDKENGKTKHVTVHFGSNTMTIINY